MKKVTKRTKPFDNNPIPSSIQTPWGRFKNFVRRMLGRPHYYIYLEDDGTYTALLIVPTKKRRG